MGYSSGANRLHCRRRGIKCVIPVKDDQAAARKRRGSAGGREFAFDKDSYKDRDAVERAFCNYKQWSALATRYDKPAIVYRAGLVLHAITSWLPQETRPKRGHEAPTIGLTQPKTRSQPVA